MTRQTKVLIRFKTRRANIPHPLKTKLHDEEDLTEATTSSGGRKRSKPAEGKAAAKTTRPQKKKKEK